MFIITCDKQAISVHLCCSHAHEVTSLTISSGQALLPLCLQTIPDLPNTAYTACLAVALMRQLSAPLPDPLWSHDRGQTDTLMSSCCLAALWLWGLQAVGYGLSGARESCFVNPKFLSESVLSRFFPLLLPEHSEPEAVIPAGTLLILPHIFLFTQ